MRKFEKGQTVILIGRPRAHCRWVSNTKWLSVGIVQGADDNRIRVKFPNDNLFNGFCYIPYELIIKRAKHE